MSGAMCGFSGCHFGYISELAVVVSRAAGRTKDVFADTDKRLTLTTNFMHPGILVKCTRLWSEIHIVPTSLLLVSADVQLLC